MIDKVDPALGAKKIKPMIPVKEVKTIFEGGDAVPAGDKLKNEADAAVSIF